MPVAPGRSVAILVEVAARNQLLRTRGHHAARALAERQEQTLRESTLPSDDEEDEEVEPGGPR
jgi:HPr kinase/phosphorylase